MTNSLPSLTFLRNALEDAIPKTNDPALLKRLHRLVAEVKEASYRRSPREPLADLIAERDAADDALGSIFEMQADGYEPDPAVIDDFRARREACQFEIDARRGLVSIR